MTLFKFNQLLLLITNICFVLSWYVILNFGIYINLYYSIVFVLVNILCLHYLFGFLACLFSGITFADFLFTHTLHHKHIGDKSKDPDNFISDGPVLLIPFKIFYHDYFFLKFNKSNIQLFSYFLQRILQISLVSFLFLDKIHLFILFWLIPMLVIGMANALFLFYFPHYIHPLEKQLNNIGIIRHLIKISRVYHHKHHDNPANNYNFFPFERINSLKMEEKKYSLDTNHYIY